MEMGVIKMKKTNILWIASITALVLTIILTTIPASSQSGESIQVSRDILANTLDLEQTTTVRITLENLGSNSHEVIVDEYFPSHLFYGDIEVSGYGYGHLQLPYHRWIQTIPPGQTKTIEYEIRPLYVGDSHLLPMYIYSDTGVEIIEETIENRMEINCVPNGVCEVLGKGENTINCPTDCPTGTFDYICDMIEDGVCDPDCIKGDPDCTEFCGDETCNGLETQRNCQEDCGYKDFRIPSPYEETVEEESEPECGFYSPLAIIMEIKE
jgi:hypothetical protein